jgi:CheY-like chemotaxis protein
MTSGRRVLIVEDEALIALLLEDMVQELGYEVAGTAHSLDAAMDAEPASYDLAILDVSLSGRDVYPFAVTLAARGTPFAFATGAGALGFRKITAARCCCRSPSGRTRWRAFSISSRTCRETASPALSCVVE